MQYHKQYLLLLPDLHGFKLYYHKEKQRSELHTHHFDALCINARIL